MQNKTKIIGTIGPASRSEDVLSKLIKNGIALARLNFSFGTHREHKEVILRIRKISEELEIPVAIIQDLQGPKLRVKKVLNGSINLIAGDSITLVENLDEISNKMISISYPNFSNFVSKGTNLLLNDGLIELEVEAIEPEKVHCKVVHGGILVEGKGLNIPNPMLKMPAITEKDKTDLEFGLKNEVDFIALSFVRTGKDILELKKLIAESKKDVEVIAKIEKPEAIDNITEILQATDAIMVARGDLAIEMPLERVPSLQRKLIELCHIHTKPVIIATQMLYTMEVNPRPSRAEVSDVANAIHDRTDVVMLSGETAIGKYPVESVQTLVRIIKEAEKMSSDFIYKEKYEIKSIHRIESGVSSAVCHLANVLQAKAIFTFTSSGFTPLAISKQRPSTPIIALTPYKEVQRRCKLYWGVRAIVVEEKEATDEMFDIAEDLALKENLAKRDDIIIITGGIPFGIKGTTNLIKVHTIQKKNP